MEYFGADDQAAFADWWLWGGRKPRAQTTLDSYLGEIRRYLEWAAEQDHKTTTVRVVQRYVAHRRKVSEHSAELAVRALKTYSKWIAFDDKQAGDILSEIEYIARAETVRTPVAELEDIDALLATCDDSMEGCRDRAIICLLRATGMRRQELSLMEWSRLDRDGCTIFLPPSDTKSGKGRTVAYDRDTADALRRYVRAFERWQERNGTDHTSDSDRVWIGRFGPLTANGVGQMIEKRAGLAGVDVRCHSFRRSLAIRWLREGRSETLLQRVAGWADPKMVSRYTKVVQEAESLAQQRALLDAEAKRRRRVA